MTNKEKLEKLKKLADAMYYAAFNLTTDTSLLRKAMNEYHQFIVHEYHKEEPVSEDLEKIVEEIVEPTILNAYGTKELARRLRNTICGTSVSEDLEESAEKAAADAFFVSPQWTAVGKELFKAGVEWQKEKDSILPIYLDEYINELSKQFPEVSFAKLSRIAVRVAKWLKEQMMAKAIDAQCFGFQGDALFSFRLPADNYLVGSKVKVIVIKED